MNGRRRVRGWGALGCSNLTGSGARGGVARDVTTDEQEQKLLQVIKDHKRAIGWTLADIPGISPSFCMHRILLEEDAKPVRQPQRRLNPHLMEVVKKEVTKLLQAGIIYPISDSTWVSPVHVAPRNLGSPWSRMRRTS